MFARLLVSALLGVLLLGTSLAQAAKPPKDPVYIQVSPFPPGGEFLLDSASGPVGLEDLRGRAVLLFFGYTSCPDVCPMSMSTASAAYALLSAEEQARFVAVFVSVDPERDTPEVLKAYAEFFPVPMLGLTSRPEVIAELADRYGAQYYRVELPGSPLGYSIDHSAALYLIDPQGKLRKIFRHQAPPERVAEDIRQVLQPSGQMHLKHLKH